MTIETQEENILYRDILYKREGKEEGERASMFSLAVSFSKCLQQLASQDEVRSPELNPSLLCGWQRPKDPGHHLLLPRDALAGSWNLKYIWELKLRH